MKTKHLLIGLAALIFVAGALVLLNRASNRKPTAAEKSFLPGLDTAQIVSLRISEKDSVVDLQRQNGKWVLPVFNNYRADSSKTNKALRNLKELEKRDLISSNAGKQATFEVDSLNGCRILAKGISGTILADFWIGKPGADWRSNYLRKQGSTEVYSSSISVKWDFRAIPKEWKDKTFWELNKSAVTRVEFSSDSGKFAVQKSKNGGWQKASPDSATADSSKIRGFLQALSDLKIDEWAGPEDGDLSKAFQKTSVVLRIQLADGTEKVLTVGDKMGQFNLVKVLGDPLIYKFYDYRVTEMKKTWKYFEAGKANLEQTLQAPPPGMPGQ